MISTYDYHICTILLISPGAVIKSGKHVQHAFQVIALHRSECCVVLRCLCLNLS